MIVRVDALPIVVEARRVVVAEVIGGYHGQAQLGRWWLPSALLGEGEQPAQAAARVLRDQLGGADGVEQCIDFANFNRRVQTGKPKAHAILERKLRLNLNHAGLRLKAIPANTPQRQSHLNSLPAGKVTRVQLQGKTYYAFPDTKNQVLYVGQEAQFQKYQKLCWTHESASPGLSDAEIVPAMKRMVCGAARTLLESGLNPAEVMDLIPVKPLAEMEPQVAEMYRTRLPALFQKIKP